MKKLLLLILVLSILIMPSVNAKTNKLESIAKGFNKHSAVKSLNTKTTSWKSKAKGNKLTIDVAYEEDGKKIKEKLVFTLNKNILSGVFKNESSFTASIATQYLIDSIGVKQGFKENDMIPTINYQMEKHTLKESGFEIKQGKKEITVKIDLEKNFKLKDFSNISITEKDLKKEKKNLTGTGSYQLAIGNLILYKDNKNFYIMEINKSTHISYESMVSLVKVVTDSDKVVNYFKKNYKSIEEDKDFKGFKITSKLTKAEKENINIDGYEIKKIRIDKKKAIDAANKTKCIIAIACVSITIVAIIICAAMWLTRNK